MPRILVAVFAAALLPAGAATVYRCDGPGGTPSFQQQPCAGAGRAVDATPANPPLAFDPRSPGPPAVRRDAATTEDEALRRFGAPTLTNTDFDTRGGVARRHVWRYADGSTRTVKTRDGRVVAIQQRPAPRRRAAAFCPSALQIRNERVSASSIALSPAERAERERRIERMERCGELPPGPNRASRRR